MSLQLELIKTKNTFEAILMVLISLILSLISIALIVAILSAFKDTEGNAYLAIDYDELYRFAIRDVITDRENIAWIFFWATPLILTGLAVAIAFQAGLFNIGGQGQMLVGGAFAGIWAAHIVPKTFLSFLDTPWIMIPTTLFWGFVGGAIWGYLPGLLKAKTGAHEVITTIMMNFVATSFVTYLVGAQTYSPFIDDCNGAARCDAYSQTDIMSPSSVIKPIFSDPKLYALNWGILIAFLVIILIHLLINKSTLGFQIRAVGLNKTAAEAAGINSVKITVTTMIISGGVAGLAGAIYAMVSTPARFRIWTHTIGFDGITVSLIAQNAPLGIFVAAIFFGFLRRSKFVLDLFSKTVPSDLIFVLQALVVFFTAAPLIARRLYGLTQRSNKPKETMDEKTENNKLKEAQK